jgi:pimeloyl-ACP methyl ester carboxylesterase
MMRAMDGVHREVAEGGTPKILIYIHVGMNTLEEARGNAMRVYRAMRSQAETAQEYPILIDWQSDAVSTYLEQLRFIRGGTKDAGMSGPLTAPLYVLNDLGRAAAGAPVTWMNQGVNDAQTLAGVLRGSTNWTKDPAWANPRLDAATRFLLRLNERYKADYRADDGKTPRRQIAVSVGEKSSVTGDEWFWRGVSYSATIPLKLATGPLINGLGKPAWENMYRRTTTMFESPDAFVTAGRSDAEIDEVLDRGSVGAVSLLCYELAQKSEAWLPAEKRDRVPRSLWGTAGPVAAEAGGGEPAKYEITIVAHSMGAIVANNMLRRFPHLPVKNIVYMGAACTINDFRQSVVPFMQSAEHGETEFYNLCLDPVAETLDTEAYDLVPRGSLLVWIDTFLENPRTPLDRMLGRWENIIQATYIFPEEIRGRVTIKAFGLLGWDATAAELAANPQKHGDFSRRDFWRPEFWRAGPPMGEAQVQDMKERTKGNEKQAEDLGEGLKKMMEEGK